MLLNIVYSGGIDPAIDTTINDFATGLKGESLGAGCWLLGDMPRDMQFRVPNDCIHVQAAIIGYIKFIVGERLVKVELDKE